VWDSDFSQRRLGEMVVRTKRPFKPEDGASYPLLGVRWYAAGCHVHNACAESLKSPTLTRLQPGDIIYNKMWASKGSFGVVDVGQSDAVATSEYPVFRARPGLDTDFLRLVFEQPRFWSLAKAWSSGTTGRARLHPRDFLRLPVPLPPKDEQFAMAAVFKAIEVAEQRTQVFLDALATAKHWTMRELLTLGHPRFRTDMQPLPSTWPMGRVAPNIQEIPAHWQLVQLTKVARLESGHTPSRKRPEYWGGDIPWVSLADAEGLNSLVIRTTNENTNQLGIQNSSARVLPEGTVVFSRTASVGLCSQLGRPMATSQDFANWVCGPRLDPRYLVQVFRHMDREWRRLQAGSTHQTVYMPVFKKLRVLLPSREEQEAIADVGRAFDTRIEAETRYLAELNELKRGLAKELLSGRVRIPAELIAKINDIDGRVGE